MQYCLIANRLKPPRKWIILCIKPSTANKKIGRETDVQSTSSFDPGSRFYRFLSKTSLLPIQRSDELTSFRYAIREADPCDVQERLQGRYDFFTEICSGIDVFSIPKRC